MATIKRKVVLSTGLLLSATTLLINAQFNLPAEAESAAQLADSMQHGFDLQEVLFPLQQAIRENPRNPDLHYLMGKLYMERGGCRLRGARELQICLDLAPPGYAHARECRDLLDSFNKTQSGPDKKQHWSNLDYWFDEQYKNRKYDSLDPDAEPSWVKDLHKNREWKVDVHFIEGNFVHPDGSGAPASCFGDLAHNFMTNFHDRFEELAKARKVEGSAIVYFLVDQNRIMHPVFAELKGGEQFKKILQDVCRALNGSSCLSSATGSRLVFKAKLASRLAMPMSGTWYAFTSGEGKIDREQFVFLRNLLADTAGARKASGRSGGGSLIMLPSDGCDGMTFPSVKRGKGSSGESARPYIPNHVSPGAADASANVALDWIRVPAAANASAKAAVARNDRSAALSSAKQSMQQSDFANCYQKLWPLVEGGDADANFLMGKALSSENNPQPQPRVAELFFNAAARKSNLEATELLSDAVEFGNSQVPWTDAVKMLKLAADKNSANACFTLGRHLEFGDGLLQDKNLALQYYRRAVAAGNPDAENAIARLNLSPARH